MAIERGYQQQVGPAQPVGLPQANAAAFGAGIGQEIERIGATAHDERIRAYRIERQQTADSEAADFAARFAQAREDADKASIDARTNAAPGGSGHADQSAAWWDQRRTALLDGITDDRVRRSAQAQLEEFGGRYRAAEYQWQEGARVGKVVTDTKAASDIAAQRAYRQHDQKAFGEELSLGRQSIEAMEGVPPDVREQLIQHHEQTVASSFLNGVADTNPKAVGPMLDSGKFDALISPEQAIRLRNVADADIRRQAAQAAATETHNRAIIKDELGATEVTLNAGGGTVADRTAVADRYDALGDKSRAAEWRGKAQSFGAAQGARSMTLPEIDERISALTAKQGRGGLRGTEAHELAGLTDARSATASRLNQPGGALLQYQYATGQTLQPLDPANAGAMRARGAAALAAAGTYGRNAVEPILPSEIDGFRDLMGGAPGGKLKVLEQLQAFGDPRAIAGAARQIAGNDDGDFRIAATLPINAARDVLRGGETLRGNAGVWSEKQAASVMQTYYRRTLALAGQGYADDVFAAAKNLYAERMTRGGETKWNAGRFAEAIEAAMGRVVGADGKARGGIAHTSQGIVLVPATDRPDQFLARFVRATPEQYVKASGGRHPRWADGGKMTEAQFKRLLPTAIGGGRYGFRGPDGGMVEDDQGGVYSIDPGTLGR